MPASRGPSPGSASTGPARIAPASLVSVTSTNPDTAASPAATAAPGAPARNTHFLYEKYRKTVPSPVPTRLATLKTRVPFMSSP